MKHHRSLLTLVGIMGMFGALAGCSPAMRDSNDPGQGVDASVDASVGDAATPPSPDLSYSCGAYANYQARVSGVVRSPCAYDVSKILSIGGNVKTRITPPTISMEFPDGTLFTGPSDGKTFTARRITQFPFEDGCTWQATETLSGTIDDAKTCTLTAGYTYREAPISPPPCATACTIDAQVIIDRVSIRVD